MDDPAVVNALYWLSWMPTVRNVAAALVAAGVILEFAEGWISEPWRKTVDNAREQRIAELNNETARLTKQSAPRQIDGAAFLKALAGKPKAPVEIVFPKEDGEAFMLALQFRDLLRVAKWQVTEPAPIPPNEIPRLANEPSHMAAGGQAIGVTVAMGAETEEEMKLLGDSLKMGNDPEPNTPLRALWLAILQSLGNTAAHLGVPGSFNTPAPGVIRIIVGPKP